MKFTKEQRSGLEKYINSHLWDMCESLLVPSELMVKMAETPDGYFVKEAVGKTASGIEFRYFADDDKVEFIKKHKQGGMISHNNKEKQLTEQHLETISEYAKILSDKLSKNDTLPTWVLSKISKVEQTMADVKHNLEHLFPQYMEQGGNLAEPEAEHVKMQLLHLGRYAIKLLSAVKDGMAVEPWMFSRLAVAAADIDSVKHYLDYHFFGEKLEHGGNLFENGGNINETQDKNPKMPKQGVLQTGNTGKETEIPQSQAKGSDSLERMQGGAETQSKVDADILSSEFYKQGGLIYDLDQIQVLDSEGKPAIDTESISLLTKRLMELPQTKFLHLGPDGDYTPERKALHRQIINELKKDIVCVTKTQPIAILMGGSPASGKSTFVKKYRPYLLESSIFKIDADEIRAKLPEYRGFNATQTHQETKDIVNSLLSDKTIGVPCDFDLIYDGTMNNVRSYRPLIDLLKNRGYKVFLVYINNVDYDTILNRMLQRYRKSGRFVPVEVIDDFFEKGNTAFNELKKYVDGYIVVDGSSQDYNIMESGGMEIPNKRDYEKIGQKPNLSVFAKGGRARDMMFVNKAEDYEIRYASKSNTERTGYKGNTKFANGGNLPSSEHLLPELLMELELSAEPSDNNLYADIPAFRIPVTDLRDASLKAQEFRDVNGLYASNWTDAKVFEGGKEIARISYNGRVWEIGNWSPKTKELLIDIEPSLFAEGGIVGRIEEHPQYIKAFELGKKAYKNGLNRIPAHDEEAISMLKGRTPGNTPKGEIDSIALMEAWEDGWIEARSEERIGINVGDEGMYLGNEIRILELTNFNVSYVLLDSNGKITSGKRSAPINDFSINFAKFPNKEQSESGLQYRYVPKILFSFMPYSQAKVIGDAISEFQEPIIRLMKVIKDMPKTYETDGKGKKAIVWLHYFKGGMDWYITEKDMGDPKGDKESGIDPNAQHQAFGYADLGYGAEAGYISIAELIKNEVELDLYWEPTSVENVLEGKKEKIETATKSKTSETLPWQKKYDNPYLLNKAIEDFLESKGMSTDPSKYSSLEKVWMRQYSGMGGLEKFGAEGVGLLYEYYTPEDIIKKMWGLAYKYGYNNGSVLEPSCGTGKFIQFATDKRNVTGFEINKYSHAIAKVNNPEANIQLRYFEELFIENNSSVKSKVKAKPYDLIIGNPPYGNFEGKYAGMGEKAYTKAKNYIEYFILRGLDVLNPGGLLVMVIGTEVANGGTPFLQQGMTPAKQAISEKANLLEAYRLPNGVFDRTDVLTDIVVIQKKP